MGARQQGLNEDAIAQVNEPGYGDLEPKHKAALALADALMTQPGAIDPQVKAELKEHFSHDQILELTLDVMKWNYQKVSVALGSDDAIVPGEIADLEFDDDGHFINPSKE